MPDIDLGRFVEAHADHFDRALDEIEAGRKQSHWMWYIFPQVDGLGASATSRRYAIASASEADAFLLHPLLGRHYRRIVDAVWRQAVERGVGIQRLLGSPDDAKLVSSLTLFAGFARRLDPPRPEFTAFLDGADEILRAAYQQGLAPCTITEAFLAR